MEQKRNSSDASRHWWEDWDGQDSSVPETPWVPDEIDRLLHPELNDLYPPVAPAPPSPPPPPPLPPAPPAYVPTPEDTGFYYKNGRPIPPTHPDHGPMHLLPRQEDGSFSSYYYCSHEQLDAFALPRTPPPRRVRRDGFSAERQAAFVEHYRTCGSLTDAARLTKVSRTTVYSLLNSEDGAAFRDAIAEAGRGVDTLLEATALERCINGQEEIVYHQGRRVGVRWRYDNRLLMHMLRARQPLKYAPLSEVQGWLRQRGPDQPVDLDPPLARLAAAEHEWGRRLPGEPRRSSRALSAPSTPLPLRREGPARASAWEGEGTPAEAPPPLAWSCTGQGRLAPAAIASAPPTPAPAEHPFCASTSSSSEPEAPVCASSSSTFESQPPPPADPAVVPPPDEPPTRHSRESGNPETPPPPPGS